MPVELRPLGVKCNIACKYCYQHPQRAAGNQARSYNIESMKSAIEREGGSFTLFGGEPLLLPERDLEELWSWGFQRSGSNSVQTNGTTINENHIRMFRQYKVQVGISMDGPGELNSLRWAGSPERTAEATERTQAAIERLCREGIVPTLIVTMHRINAEASRLPRLIEWLANFDALGVTYVRLHILESEEESIRGRYGLSTAENVEAFLALARLERSLPRLRFDLFADMRSLLMGRDKNVTCLWTACDPYTTASVRGVEGHGQRSNCGRVNKDGIDYVKADSPGFERYLVLYSTPWNFGGCSGCRFFLICKGQCPGTAIDGDWRNRTEHCEVWKQLLEFTEQELIASGKSPLTAQPALRERLERLMIDSWSRRQNPALETLLESIQPAAALPSAAPTVS
jgi:uncharacterized protein